MAEYQHPENLNKVDRFTWDPSQQVYAGEGATGPDFLGWLLNWRTRAPQNTLDELEQAEWRKREAAARAIPTRDISTLTAGWAGDPSGEYADPSWWTSLNPTSPDAAPILLALRDKLDAGTATPQERDLYGKTMEMSNNWVERASTPDNFSLLGDQFFGALGTLALGATGGLAAAPLAAGGAGLTTTLGSLGTLAGIGGTAAGALGQEMDIDWLRKAGMGLGAAGGIAGGIGGLANLWGTGVNSLGDAARLASNAGRVVGGVGSLANNDVLRRAGGYLGMAGQLGGGVNTLANVLGGEGINSLQDAARLARGLGQVASVAGRVSGNRPTQQASNMLGLASTLGSLGGGVRGLLGAAQGVQRGATSPQRGVPFAPVDWLLTSSPE